MIILFDGSTEDDWGTDSCNQHDDQSYPCEYAIVEGCWREGD